MKSANSLLIVILTLQGTGLVVNAQISNDEASISNLAVQCALSSGYPASNFQAYSQGLAKTLAPLSGEQQIRVFGYLPQPTPNTKPGKTQTTPKALNGASGNSNASTNPAPMAPDPGLLVDLVGSLNSALSGSTTAPQAFMGTSPPAPDSGAQSSPIPLDPILSSGVTAEPTASTGSGALVADAGSMPTSPEPTAGSGTGAAAAQDSPPLAASAPSSSGVGASAPPAADSARAGADSAPLAAASAPAGADAGASGPSFWDQVVAFVEAVDAGYQADGVAGAQEVIVETIPTFTAP